MHPSISFITLAVEDLERAVAFYRDGLGLATKGIVGSEFEHGAAAFFDMQPGLKLALWPRASLAAQTGFAPAAGAGAPRVVDSNAASMPRAVESYDSTRFALAHNVASAPEVDALLARAARAGATIVKAACATFYGGHAGWFQDPDGHLWEVAFNPGFESL